MELLLNMIHWTYSLKNAFVKRSFKENVKKQTFLIPPLLYFTFILIFLM